MTMELNSNECSNYMARNDSPYCLKIKPYVASLILVLSIIHCPAEEIRLDINHPYDKLSKNIVTSHIKWGKPYYYGKTKILIITPMLGQRETIELAERFDLDYTPVMTFSDQQMYGDPKWGPHSVQATVVDAIIRNKLKTKYDVIIIGKVNWDVFPLYLKDWIMKTVYEGTGLIYISKNDSKEVNSIFFNPSSQKTNILPNCNIPIMALPVVNAIEKNTFINANQYGHGKTFKIDYLQKNERSVLHSLTPTGTYQNTSLYYEYYHSLLGKLILAAAPRIPEASIKDIAIRDHTVYVRYEKNNNCKNIGNVTLELAIRDIDNKNEHDVTIDASFVSGIQCGKFTLPYLKDGIHFIDIWLKKDGKILDWGSSSLNTTHEDKIDCLTTDKESYKVGDTIKVQAILNREPPKNLNLEIQLIDNFNRVIDEIKTPANAKAQNFSLIIKQALSPAMKIKCKLLNDKNVSVSENHIDLAVKQTFIDDYSLGMWLGGGEEDNHMGSLMLDLLHQKGIDYIYLLNPDMACRTANANLKIIPYLSRMFFPGYGRNANMPAKSTIRKPCFADPVFRNALKNSIQKDVKTLRKYTSFYSLSINAGLTPTRGDEPLDLCTSTDCQLFFRKYLIDEYKTLDALNMEWNTRYISWDDIIPMTFAEAQQHGDFVAWVDHRICMEKMFTTINKFSMDAVKEIDPDATIGIDEPNTTNSYNGYSWFELMNILDFCNPYFGQWHWRDDQIEMTRSFIKNTSSPKCIWFGTYCRDSDFNKYIPWQSLFHGYNGVCWWEGVSTIFIGALDPSMEPLPYFKIALKEINDIKKGIGKLIINSKREDDGIAIHYSPACVHAATIEASKLPVEATLPKELMGDLVAPPDILSLNGSSYPLYKSQVGFMTALEDIGLQYSFISGKQIENGILGKSKYKLLILPNALSLSKSEVIEIILFIRNGGNVIADSVPGVLDEHCKKRSSSQLFDVFGASNKETQIVKDYGEGKSVCINEFLNDYKSLRQEGTEENKRETLRIILADMGVTPRLKIVDDSKKNTSAIEVVFYKFDQITLVCLLKDYLIKDSVTKNISITFPYESYIYDLRKNEFCGKTNLVNTRIAPAEAKVFAMSPYMVSDLHLVIKNKNCKPGEQLEYSINVTTNIGTPSLHVFHVEVSNPNGDKIKYYTSNALARKGEYKGELLLSKNEKKGMWKIIATDLMSGKVSEATFQIN